MDDKNNYRNCNECEKYKVCLVEHADIIIECLMLNLDDGTDEDNDE